MSSAEIKEHIIESLSGIEDLDFLKQLAAIIDSRSNIYKLSDVQQQKVNEAIADYKNGRTISHEDLDRELDQWLDSK